VGRQPPPGSARTGAQVPPARDDRHLHAGPHLASANRRRCRWAERLAKPAELALKACVIDHVFACLVAERAVLLPGWRRAICPPLATSTASARFSSGRRTWSGMRCSFAPRGGGRCGRGAKSGGFSGWRGSRRGSCLIPSSSVLPSFSNTAASDSGSCCGAGAGRGRGSLLLRPRRRFRGFSRGEPALQGAPLCLRPPASRARRLTYRPRYG